MIGRADVIAKVSPRALRSYHGGAYVGPNVVLAASGQVPAERLAEHACIGELGLDGGVRPVAGTIAAAEGAAVLVVSSEFKEIVDLCHRAVLVSHGRIVGPFDGELTEDNLTDTVYAQEASA